MMGWFEEQVKIRKLSDQEVLEDSFMRTAQIINGKHVFSELNNDISGIHRAIDEILKYYHYKPTEIKDNIKDLDETLEYLLRPHGIMRRNVKLDEKWYLNAYGPLLGFTIDEQKPIALIPKTLGSYYYIDDNTGNKININSETAKNISDDAICFYRPLPLKELGIKDLLLYLKDCISIEDIIPMIISTIIISSIGLIGPRLTKALTGPVLNSKDLSLLISIAIFMVCTSFSTSLFNASHSLINSRISSKTSLAVEAAVMSRVLSLPPTFFRKYSSGELASRASSINSLCNLLLSFVFSLGLTSLSSLLYINQIFSFAKVLVIPSLIIIILSILTSIISSIVQIRISKSLMEVSAKKYGLSYALISGIQKIKLSGAEKRAFSKWLDQFNKEAEYSYNPPTILKINSVISLAISLIGNIVLYYLAVKNNIGQSNYFAFNASFGLVMGAFSSLAGIGLSFARVRPILEMAEPILKEVPEVSENREIITNLKGKIELNSVSFRYDDKSPYVIDDLSLKINPKEYIAIVGKTGCGKSTLMRLLLGFEKPTQGAIYYDNKDIESIDLKSLRRKIGTVMQSGSLFQGDIYSNIAIAAPSLTLDEAWEAADIAGIGDDIRNMPMGMQTYVAEGQAGFSGGQKQRIMIARAIAPKPKILMFDEATSALDNITQRKISEALDKLNCTRIVIAHRLSTIKNCDRILVLDKGKIIEEGTYDELVDLKGYFYELVERQRIDTE